MCSNFKRTIVHSSVFLSAVRFKVGTDTNFLFVRLKFERRTSVFDCSFQIRILEQQVALKWPDHRDSISSGILVYFIFLLTLNRLKKLYWSRTDEKNNRQHASSEIIATITIWRRWLKQCMYGSFLLIINVSIFAHYHFHSSLLCHHSIDKWFWKRQFPTL